MTLCPSPRVQLLRQVQYVTAFCAVNLVWGNAQPNELPDCAKTSPRKRGDCSVSFLKSLLDFARRVCDGRTRELNAIQSFASKCRHSRTKLPLWVIRDGSHVGVRLTEIKQKQLFRSQLCHTTYVSDGKSPPTSSSRNYDVHHRMTCACAPVSQPNAQTRTLFRCCKCMKAAFRRPSSAESYLLATPKLAW
jgi:hypothetical protein